MAVRGHKQLDIYTKAMAHGLESNAHKGNWLTDAVTGEPLTNHTFLWELLYHVFKLSAAIVKRDRVAVLQYAADVGNCAWFIADAHDALDLLLLTTDVIEYADEPVDTAEGFAHMKAQAYKLAQQLLDRS